MVGVRPPIRATSKFIRTVLATRSSAWTTCTAVRAAAAGSTLWRHRALVINLGRGDYQQAFRAFSGRYYFAVLAPVQHPFHAVEAQATFGPVFAVTAHTRGLE